MKAGAKAYIYHKCGYVLKAEKPMSPTEIALMTLQKIIAAEAVISEHEDRIKAIESKQKVIDKSVNEFTVLAYFVHAELGHLSIKDANSIGRKIVKHCKAEGLTISSMPDPRFGKVNCYPEPAIEHVLIKLGYIK